MKLLEIVCNKDLNICAVNVLNHDSVTDLQNVCAVLMLMFLS